jgi:hypothetical protein
VIDVARGAEYEMARGRRAGICARGRHVTGRRARCGRRVRAA